MIAGLLLYLALPLVMASVVYILRRWVTLSALLTIGTAAILGGAILLLPFDRPVQLFGREIAMGNAVTFLGRELVIEQADRMAIAFLFLTAGGIFTIAWRVTPDALLFPVGLGLLSLLVGTLLIRPLIYAALLLEIAAALSIFALQVEEQSSNRGGLRYLTFAILALPGMMITHWLMERYALTPEDVGLLNASAILLVISFALLLGSVPFHTWVPAVTSDGEPLAGAFILTISNGAVWFLLLDYLETYPKLSSHPRFGPLASGLGLAMVVVGGLLAPAQRRIGRLIGYGALIDTGGALLALGMHNQQGISLTLLTLVMRPFGLALMAAGLSGLRRFAEGGDDGYDALQGLAWRAPWSTLALVVGGLSTAGLPGGAGFVARWNLFRSLALSDPGAALLLLLAGGGVMIGLGRGLSALLRHPPAPEEKEESDLPSEGWPTAVIASLASVVCVGVGLFPQPLASLVARLAETYTFFTP